VADKIIAIKSETEWVLDVLGVPFGGPNNGRDSDGEFFDAKTNAYTDRYRTPPAVYYHGYSENGRPAGEPQFIGKSEYTRTDERGHWYRVVLDKANAYAKRVWEAALQGLARASSGSIQHLVRKKPNGHITHWPVAELSIFDAVGDRQPANQYAVALPALKMVYAQAGVTLPDDIEVPPAREPEADAEGEAGQPSQSASAATGQAGGVRQNNNSHREITMPQEEIQALVAKQMAEALKAQKEAEAAEAARRKEIADATEAAVKATRESMQAELAAAKAEAAEARRLPGGGAPGQTQFAELSKFDGLGPTDMAVMAGILAAAKMANRGPGVSEVLRRALAVRIADDPDQDGHYGATKNAMKMAGMPMKANELNQSTLASYGDEWIGVTYSAQLWDKIRMATPIVGRIPTVTIPQGSESIIIPLEATPPIFYKVAQASAQAANPGRITPTYITSRQGTSNNTLTAAKLGAAMNYTGELEEDSLIPWASEIRRILTVEASEVLEHLVIDGDTETGATANINTIGGTPAGTEAYLLFNGFRKLALVTNTANALPAGTLDIEDVLETAKLMGLGGRNSYDRNQISVIADMATYWKLLTLTEMKSRDFSQPGTVSGQTILTPWGFEVIGSPNMHRANQDATYGLKANAAGKVDLTTPSNNTKGAMVGVRWDQWRLGYKRRMTFEVDRDPISDATTIVVNMRIGLVYRDTEASSISYNITV
jgi:hypothetical protein